MDLTRINFEIPSDVKKEIQLEINKEGMTIKGLMQKLIYKWLKERKQQK